MIIGLRYLPTISESYSSQCRRSTDPPGGTKSYLAREEKILPVKGGRGHGTYEERQKRGRI